MRRLDKNSITRLRLFSVVEEEPTLLTAASRFAAFLNRVPVVRVI